MHDASFIVNFSLCKLCRIWTQIRVWICNHHIHSGIRLSGSMSLLAILTMSHIGRLLDGEGAYPVQDEVLVFRSSLELDEFRSEEVFSIIEYRF